MMKLSELLHPWVSISIPDCEITGLRNDSRHLVQGDLFFAYPGALTDGRLFMEQACLSGAAAIVYDPQSPPPSFVIPSAIPCIPVVGLGAYLSEMASRFYAEPSQHLSVTGVTGTNGKTTIAWLLAQAYERLSISATYIGTLGYGDVHALQPLANTTPDALFLQRFFYDAYHRGVEQVCMEVSSHALSQGRVACIDFTGAIYTNLSHEHLDYHHTMDAYAEAKASLFACPSLKWAVLNHDDASMSFMSKKIPSSCQKITYGLRDGCDVRAVTWHTSMTGSHLEVISPWGKHAFDVQLLGAFNVYNALAVFASLLANGMLISKVPEMMGQLQASPGRMEVVSQKPCVIVDFAHTPDALENALKTLQQVKKGRLGVVFGCGGNRDKGKRPIMGDIAKTYADFVVITSDNPRQEVPVDIIEDIAAGMPSSSDVTKMVDREKAIHFALAQARDEDIILIAGKGHEAYQLIGTARLPFSDQDVVRRWMAGR